MHGFWQRRKLRRRWFADRDWEAVCARVPLLGGLGDAELALLREQATLFLADKIVAPSASYALRTDQAIEIAAWAALPILHRGTGAYSSFRGVIVYPDEFLAPREEIDEFGVVHSGHEEVIGESWDDGPMLLSWADVEASRVPGCGSVVIHECAHKLDLGDGEMNGVPDLARSGIDTVEWARVMRAAWESMGREEEERGETTIDGYALESPAEFFAVLCEEFFTAPRRLRRRFPEAHALLARYFGVDSMLWRPQGEPRIAQRAVATRHRHHPHEGSR
jgi:hypothetical protein